jgi:acyl dehydratase
MIEVDLTSLTHRVGIELAVSEWTELTQARIQQFADATGDHQWIHLDEARAAAESPFGTTIAHGFLTLSLAGVLLRRAMRIGGVRMAVNYGVNRVRFVAPVPAGSRIRGRFSALSVEPAPGATQVTWSIVIEREGAEKPCCVAEWVVRYYPAG